MSIRRWYFTLICSLTGLIASSCSALAASPELLDEVRAHLAARRFAAAEQQAAAALGPVTDPRQAGASDLRLMALRARALTGLGRRADALALRQALVPVMERELGETDLDTLAELRSLAAQYYYFDRLDDALLAGRQAAARSRAALGATHPTTLLAESTVAQLNAAHGNAEAAAALALDVLERSQRSGADEAFIDIQRFAAAQSLRAARRYEAAAPLLRETFAYRSRSLGADSADTIHAGAQLGWTLARLGQDELAQAIVDEQYARATRLLGPDAYTTLWTASLKAELLGRAGRYAEAMPLYQDTLQRAAASGNVGLVLQDTAALAIEHGLEAGNPSPCLYLDALREAARASAPGSTLRSNWRGAEAFCDILAGDAQAAQRQIQAQLAEPSPAGAEIDRLMLRRRLAALHLARGEPNAARTELETAQYEVEQLHAQSALLRRGGMAHWVGSRPWAAGGRSLVRLLAAQGEAELAFAAAESIKARRLLDASRRNEWLEQLDSPSRAMVKSVQDDIDAAALELALALDAASRAPLEARIATAEAKLTRLAGEQARSASPANLPAPAADEVFVHLIADGDTLLLLVRSRDGISAHEARPGAAAPLVNAARRALGGEPEPDRLWVLPDGTLAESPTRPQVDAVRLRDGDALQRIAAAIAAPLAPHIEIGRRIVFAPDDAYALLPLEALPSHRGPLGLRVEVTYAHSAAMAAEASRAKQRLPAVGGGLLAIGVPHPQARAPGLDPRLAALSWSELPAVEAEINAVARRMKAVPVQSLLGPAASESGLRARDASGALRQARWIHVAAHAWYSDASPELSALVLDDAGGDATAGYLTAAELRGLHLAAELVVLSACSSAGGAVRTGEGLVGLVHALFVAGATGSIVSLWPVADAPTAAMMDELYSRIAAGLPPASALSQARRALAAAGHPPRDWAAFVYYGAN